MSFARRSAGVNVNTKEYDKRIGVVYRGLGSKGLSTIGSSAVRLLDHSAKESISSATSPGGHPWETRKTHAGWAPLQKTGQLKGSMKSTFRSSKTKVTIKAAVKGGSRSDGVRHGLVAAVQHFGRSSSAKHGRMAARRFMGLNKTGYKAILKIADGLMGKG